MVSGPEFLEGPEATLAVLADHPGAPLPGGVYVPQVVGRVDVAIEDR